MPSAQPSRSRLLLHRRIDASTVWINDRAVVYSETEEGGYKQGGVAAMDDFVEYRTFVHEVDLAGAVR